VESKSLNQQLVPSATVATSWKCNTPQSLVASEVEEVWVVMAVVPQSVTMMLVISDVEAPAIMTFADNAVSMLEESTQISSKLSIWSR